MARRALPVREQAIEIANAPLTEGMEAGEEIRMAIAKAKPWAARPDSKFGDAPAAVEPAMADLARSLPVDEVSRCAYAPYEAFRPEVPAALAVGAPPAGSTAIESARRRTESCFAVPFDVATGAVAGATKRPIGARASPRTGRSPPERE